MKVLDINYYQIMYLIIFILILYSILDWHVVKCVKTFCISILLLVSSIENV